MKIYIKSYTTKETRHLLDASKIKTKNNEKMKQLDLKTTKGRQMFYHTPEWRTIRYISLQKNPYCAVCLKDKVYVIATEVDHVIPLKERPDLCVELTNLQGLCKSCHSKKTYLENKGSFGKKPVITTLNKKWNLTKFFE
jgi:5-methylcytosine-specific restriction enzyme A